jgi:hypothetical protein
MNRHCHRLLRLPSVPGWSILRAACVLWFTITTCGIPWDFISGAPREVRCCCSPVKRQSGNCCCTPRSAVPVQLVTASRSSCCKKLTPTANQPQTGATVPSEAKSSVRSSGLAVGTAISKSSNSSRDCEIAPCSCGADEQPVWGGQYESRMLVTNQSIWRCDLTQFISFAVEQANDSPRFAPPVPPPIAAC